MRIKKQYKDIIFQLKQKAYKDGEPQDLVHQFQLFWKDLSGNSTFLNERELYEVAWVIADELNYSDWMYYFRDMLDRHFRNAGVNRVISQESMARLIIESMVLTKVDAWESI